MAHRDTTEHQGTIKKSLPNAFFWVELENGKTILAHLGGKMRKYHIRVMMGDKVNVEMTKYDENKGRIIYRYK